MKNPKQLLLSIATVLMAMTTINCGGGGSNSTPAAATPAAYGVSCGANMLTSQYGCLPQCGVSSVYYQNQCVPITQTGYGQYGQTGIPGQTGYGMGGQSAQMCQGGCPAGLVQFNYYGQTACMPQQSCGPCYAQMGGNCYIGDYAHQFYGY